MGETLGINPADNPKTEIYQYMNVTKTLNMTEQLIQKDNFNPSYLPKFATPATLTLF